MPLRCLLFATDAEMVQPIWQVLADLEIEGEHCQSAVDAVEKVTTQLFQIVVTDWEDQPEASFLLKTARDQKAASRPLTLAIVGDEARVPEALQAGANSVLLKPLRPEQVRDTLKTACELLRSKQTTPAPPRVVLEPAIISAQATAARATAAKAATATFGGKFPSAASMPGEPEKGFRAGEFLQSSGSMLGTQLDTDSDIRRSIEESEVAQVAVVTELEPMATQLTDAAPAPAAVKPRENQDALTGWAALQNRLTRPIAQTAMQAEEEPDLPSGVEAAFHSAAAAPAFKPKLAEAQAEADLHAYMSGRQSDRGAPAAAARSPRRRIAVLGAIGLVAVVLLEIPRTRQRLQIVDHKAASAAVGWLNPKPAPVPQVEAQHDSFGQDGDEYKLPVAGNIPDATTDPTQIRVVPIVDPTAKVGKDANAGNAESQPAANDNAAADPGQPAANSNLNPPAAGAKAAEQTSEQNPIQTSTSTEITAEKTNASSGQTPVPSSVAVPASVPPGSALMEPSHPKPPTLQSAALPRSSSMATVAPIPSSLRSQIASMTPEASGAKTPEAAMSAIEPVVLPEAEVRELLTEGADPQYPAAAKAIGQSGSLRLQVLIARDGTVQDAKFLQGSIMFVNAAVDAVKTWHFRPYLLNGRPVSVQSTITLSFRPPA
jgi:TonB family protein